MEFKKIQIKNFRSFENIDINVSNKNIFFGLNGVGKTNLLTALRFVFDKNMRRIDFVDTDFFKKNINENIEIIVCIDISDNQEDSQKIRSVMKGAISSGEDQVFIKLVVKYNMSDLIGDSIMYWGSTLDRLYEIPQRGNRLELDNIFQVFYVDAHVDLTFLFKKYISEFIKNNEDNVQDEHVNNQINELVSSLNEKVSELSGVSEFEEEIKPLYDLFNNDNTDLTIKSEIAVKGLYSNLVPYLKDSEDSNIYPTSGEGRKKLVVYALYTWLAKQKEDQKINLFLIEEPENNLHKSLQLDLSQLLFDNKENYKYLFMATHSSYILYEMNNVTLIRIFSNNNITSRSVVHEIPQEFQQNKQKLNRGLSEALFANRVLLVEGPSEYLLFDTILAQKFPNYAAKGCYILPINGVNFIPYYKILETLEITTIVKTDNDVQWSDPYVNVTGFKRINDLVNESLPVTFDFKTIRTKDDLDNQRQSISKNLYTQYKSELDRISKDKHVFISNVDLENDMFEALDSRMKVIAEHKSPVKYLQKSKNNNMVEFLNNLEEQDCETLYDHDYFKCLKDLVEWN